jgi:pilus assembly protein CpaE
VASIADPRVGRFSLAHGTLAGPILYSPAPMPPNPILICARRDALRTQLETALSAAGYQCRMVPTPADAVAALRSRPADLIVAEGLVASGAISSLRTASESGVTPVLVVAPARDVEARIAFLEAGADDVIVDGFANSELEGRVMALLIRAGKVRTDENRGAAGQLVAFFSPKGGVGTTTLAVNSAVLLAGGGAPVRGRRLGGGGNGALPSSRVLLMDLDLQFGQVATHLNVTPRFDIGGLATDEQALADPELGRSHLTMHSSGLAVLAAPTSPEADQRVTLDALQRIILALRPSFDEIIVDLGSRLDPRSMWILEQADAHLFVVFPEIASLRATSQLLAYLSETTPLQAHTHLIVNHIFPKALLKTRDIENLLRAKPTAEVPYTEVEMIRSVNEGVPLVLTHPTSPAAAALRRVAQAIIGVEVERATASRREQRRGLFGRRR